MISEDHDDCSLKSLEHLEMVRRLEQRLCTVIARLTAIDAMSEAWRSSESGRNDQFLFDTVYTALWDGVIVGLGVVWDDTRGVASLPRLAPVIQGFQGASKVREEIRRAGHAERAKLKAHRNKAVAHLNAGMDLVSFDEQCKIRTADAWEDVVQAKKYLEIICRCLGSAVFPFDGVAEMAKEDAQNSLALWASGSDARVQKLRDSIGL